MEFWTKTENENTFGKLFEHELHEYTNTRIARMILI